MKHLAYLEFRSNVLHGIRFVLKGKIDGIPGSVAAVHYLLWVNPEGLWGRLGPLMSVDLGYHSPYPMYEDHEPIEESCPFIDGFECYYGGSALPAMDLSDAIHDGGPDELWLTLESYYRDVFGCPSQEE